MRAKLLNKVYRLFPFNLKGDCAVPPAESSIKISCIINFYGRIDLLMGILWSLAEQNFPRNLFEVVLVEDKGGTPEGKEIADKFSAVLSVVYAPLDKNYGRLGYSRNYGLLFSKGEFILFLDDDTVIFQKDFLSVLIDEFERTGTDAVISFGSASYCLLEKHYDYHEPFFPTSRCMAYRREVLKDLHGFVSAIVGQEDVEFVTRCIAAEKKFYRSKKLSYFHPPLIVSNINKPAAVGLSFAELRPRYPFFIWLMMLINGCRYLPLYFLPFTMKWKMQGRFSFGFMLGIYYSFTRKKVVYSDNYQ